jgi:hypothetical protein
VIRDQCEQPPGELPAGCRVAHAERLLGEVPGDPRPLTRRGRKLGQPLEQRQPRIAIAPREVPAKRRLQVAEVVRVACQQGLDLERHLSGGDAALLRGLELDLPAGGPPARGLGRDRCETIAGSTRLRVRLGREGGTHTPAEQVRQQGRVGRLRNGIEACQRRARASLLQQQRGLAERGFHRARRGWRQGRAGRGDQAQEKEHARTRAAPGGTV